MSRKLAAFDFDHTIIDGNSDLLVRDILPKELISDSVKSLHKGDFWIDYMQAIFELLQKHGYKEEDVIKIVAAIPAIKGMPELIKKLSDDLNYDVIIISDANSYLIETWLEKNGLKDNILEVISNPAKFVNGLLKVECYHEPMGCKLSTHNLCKAKIMEEFLQRRKAKGIVYEKILYAGDGRFDFCPIVKLNETDFACVRDKFLCQTMVNDAKAGKPIAATGQTYNIKANIIVWNTGFDILKNIV